MKKIFFLVVVIFMFITNAKAATINVAQQSGNIYNINIAKIDSANPATVKFIKSSTVTAYTCTAAEGYTVTTEDAEGYVACTFTATESKDNATLGTVTLTGSGSFEVEYAGIKGTIGGNSSSSSTTSSDGKTNPVTGAVLPSSVILLSLLGTGILIKSKRIYN